MEGMRWLPIAAMALCAVSVAGAQSTRPADLAVGKLLVASPDLSDPNFAKTVVLLVQYDEDGVVGLILNRRSKVPISRVLGEVAGAKGRTDPVYAGGPVGRTDVLALVRSRRAPGDAKRVLGDVFLVSTQEGLEKTFASATDADAVHVYLGYSGWTAPQLANELDLGAWHVFQGSAKAVFDSDPESLWPRLIRDTELRIAFRPRGAGGDPPPLD
jgi:putative transcriptional regulator